MVVRMYTLLKFLQELIDRRRRDLCWRTGSTRIMITTIRVLHIWLVVLWSDERVPGFGDVS